MSTIRVQGIPQATTIEDISQAFSVERDCVSLASTKTTNPPASQIATVTLETDAIAKRYLGKPPKIHGKEVFIDNDFFGLTVLSSGANATADIDIVAVHGLAGHAFKTWASGHKMWLRDFLPTQLPRSRVMTYGYNSDFRDSADVSTFRNFAQRLLVSLDEKRSEQETERPIIFICHSLGGIVVKLALNIAMVEERTQFINNVTYGIVFLATPHQGSKTADYGAIVGLVAKASNMRKELVKSLQTDSIRLSEIADEFRQHHETLQIATFYEIKKTKIKGGLVLNEVVVDQRSAVLNVKHEQQSPLNRDHREICRFRHEEEDDYKAVYKQIERMAEKAVDAIKYRLHMQAPCSKHHFMVPYVENENFTGRESIMGQLEQHLLRKNCHQRVALWGLGGVGKTQVALKYAYSQRKGHSVFWVHASNQERFIQDYQKISELAQIPTNKDEEQQEVLSKVKDWLESTKSGEWIFILDNADDLLQLFPRSTSDTRDENISNNTTVGLSKFLPHGSKGTIIVTTRDLQVASWLAGGASVQVVTMKPKEAKDLFSHLGPIGIYTRDQKLSLLLEELDYLPLAIVHAAAYMRENFLLPSQYFDTFNKTKEAQKVLLSVKFNDYRRGSDVPEAVLTTYFITFDQLQNQNPLAANILRLIAFLDRQGIPRKLLSSSDIEGAQDDILFNSAIGKLQSLSLVTQVKGAETFEVHRLVHLSIQESLPDEERQEFKLKTLEIMLKHFPDGKYQNWDTCATYLPHSLVVIRWNEDSRIATLLHSVGGYLRRIGRYREGKEYLSRCLEIQEAEDITSTKTFLAASALSCVLRELGEYDKAKEMNRRALEGEEKVLGPEHPDTLATIGNLALVLQRQGKYDDAEEMNRRALEGYEKVLGPEHPSTLTSISNLALVLQSQGKYDDAEEMNRRALERYERILGQDHPKAIAIRQRLLANHHIGEIDIGEYSAVGQVPVGRSRLRLRRGIKYLFRNPGRERLPERWPIAEGR